MYSQCIIATDADFFFLELATDADLLADVKEFGESSSIGQEWAPGSDGTWSYTQRNTCLAAPCHSSYAYSLSARRNRNVTVTEV